jgi:hypothetical protein
VVPEQREDDADEEQLVPQSDRIHSDEQSDDLVGPGDVGPVQVGARAQEVHRQDQVARDDHHRQVAVLEPAPPVPGSDRELDDVLPIPHPGDGVGQGDRRRQGDREPGHRGVAQVGLEGHRADDHQPGGDEEQVPQQGAIHDRPDGEARDDQGVPDPTLLQAEQRDRRDRHQCCGE